MAFASVLDASAASSAPDTATDLTPGKLIQTGNPLDLALSGDGYFVVRAPGRGLVYTRQGQFQQDAQGRLVTAGGFVLQADGGGDLSLGQGVVAVSPDGVVSLDGEAVGKVGLADLADPAAAAWEAGGFTAPDAALTAALRPQIRQGALESSNVSAGDEMVAMMAALRRAESGQRLMMVYDDLMGRILNTFGQS